LLKLAVSEYVLFEGVSPELLFPFIEGPAKVLIYLTPPPPVYNKRMALLPESAIYICPVASRVKPIGLLNLESLKRAVPSTCPGVCGVPAIKPTLYIPPSFISMERITWFPVSATYKYE
jgi:hypothetical protein